MSQLEGAESFNSLQFPFNDYVGAGFQFGEDSIHQPLLSRALQTNRTSWSNAQQLSALRRTSQKNFEQVAGSQKTNINATISEDLGAGQTAKLDADLELLREDELQLIIPGHEWASKETHLIELGDINITAGGNHALQDYQMQLMLLEQQNKKRLLKARGVYEGSSKRSKAISIGRKGDRMNPENDFQKPRRLKFYPGMRPVEDMSPMNLSSRKRQKHSHQLEDRASQGECSLDSNGGGPEIDQAGSIESKLDGYEVLYRIECHQDHRNSTGCHPAPAFRDMPVVGTSLNSPYPHLNGNVPLYDLEGYLQSESKGNAFVAMRTVECSNATVSMLQAGVPLKWIEDIYMKSSVLKDAMRQTALCYFQPVSDGSEESDVYQNQITPIDLFFYHHRQLLQDFMSKSPQSRPYIEPFIKYVDQQFGMQFAEADNLFERGLVDQANISKLFRPNELVVSGIEGQPAAFVVQEWPITEAGGWTKLVCWSLQADGSRFSRKRSDLSIPPIGPNAIKIQDLPAYPIQFSKLELREMLRRRGQKHWKFRYAKQITYKGWNVGKDQYFPDARFMIDHKIYRKMHEHSEAFRFFVPHTTHAFDRLPAFLTAEQEPPDFCYDIMPPDIYGFYLNEKQWIRLFIDNIEPVSWNIKAFERLVLPHKTKDLVRALVTVRTSQRGVKQGLGVAGKRTDITGGKGNGLIMLLHGGPGTGKTLTAESVAEMAEMPLYRVTCGDIGINAEAVEKYLNTVLYLGKMWNCVLLLDEADVFLEERSMSDLKRNSLVSVFLRILEYYDGILILTSNRVGLFDEAFKSRIQVALHYENLNRSARKKIWQNFLDMLEEDEEDVNFDEIKLHLDDLAGKELNGRQIRNVLTTARQLALYRNERLEWEHLEQALSVSSDFNEYLKRMQGHTDDQRARDIKLR